MPLQSTSGAASYDAFGGGTVAKVNYIEDFFQSYLRTGTGASATVTTGLDGSTKETLVWTKSRSAATNHKLTDNVRGATKALSSNTTSAEATDSQGLTAFSATGYTIGTNTDYNNSGATYVDWQWVSQAKFFDVVTFTGNGNAAGQTINHNLGSVPGFIICKSTSATGDWAVCARTGSGTPTNSYATGLSLNSTGAALYSGSLGDYPTATTFSTAGILDNSGNYPNTNGVTYVAYLFAHNAGGFGLTGTDNVISCGSFTQSIGGFVNLGFEPQWVLTKRTSGVDDWRLFDNMRGMTMGDDSLLNPNLSAAENNSAGNDYLNPQPTGFTTIGFDSGTHIYIAIRRGPMKVPTSGTSVFRPMIIPINSASATTPINAGLTTDVVFGSHNSDESGSKWFASRLTANYRLNSTSTAAEALGEYYWDNMVGVRQQETNAQPVWYFLKRAPSFFDVVCYTGTGSVTAFSHNLAAVPELIIFKRRSNANPWMVYCNRYNGGVNANQYYQTLDSTDSESSGSGLLNNTNPTSSVFTVGTWNENNFSGSTFVAYLFATCAGVSKVGSYTGNGSTQTIDCGFGAGGARFVLIKRTDSTGGWYVYDTARGMTVLTDPYLFLNSTAAETATLGSVTTVSTGFALNATVLAAINTNAASYIFLAIA